MGGFCTPSYDKLPDATDVVEGTEIPEWVAAAGRELFTSASGIASSPYPIYEGERTATFGGSTLTEDERLGMQMLREGSQDYLPYINRAADVANTLGGGYDSMSRQELLGDEFQATADADLMGQYEGATREELLGGPFSVENAQEYMDIYQQSMDPAIREIEEQTIRAQNQARESAARSGAFGGSRLGILEGTAAGEGAEAAGDLRAQAAREGLSFAADRFDTDREARFGAEDVMRGQFMEDRAGRFGLEDARYGRYGDQRAARFGAEDAARTGFETDEAARIAQMNAYQNLGPMVQDLQNRAAAGLISSGEAQRVLEQRALDLAYADYMDQKQYPMEMVNFALGALSGTPYSTRNRSYELGSSYSANPSVYGQLISGIGAGYSAYKMANS
tara:strand:+ start:6615 stop:7787 length:1173 start_codon:yes stop_codon:yes gene_type:complete